MEKILDFEEMVPGNLKSRSINWDMPIILTKDQLRNIIKYDST